MKISHEKTRGRPDVLNEKGERILVHPTPVKGKWQFRREVVKWALLGIFLVLPWVQINGHQAFLMDIAHRKFVLFGKLFFAQDVPLLFLVLITFILGVALITSKVGRVWCGWACPQTVYIETFFRRIETWIEGSAEVRRRRQVTKEKLPIYKTALKWTLFSLITIWITHSVLGIFIGTDRVLQIVGRPIGENTAPFIFIVISNLVLLWDFGWLREQFCMIACPYGKFLSVLQDRQSLTVHYLKNRGEPRRGMVNPGETQGDCIDCGRCVSVCPTGIDIRHGNQLECIACTACIDACDDVMTRLNKPKGLIGYYSEIQALGEKVALVVRPRVIIYSILLTVFSSVLIYKVLTFQRFEVNLFKQKGMPYQTMKNSDGIDEVTNLFQVEFANKSEDDLDFVIRFEEPKDDALIATFFPLHVPAGKFEARPVTLRFHPHDLKSGSGERAVIVEVTNRSTGEVTIQKKSVHLVGPYQF